MDDLSNWVLADNNLPKSSDQDLSNWVLTNNNNEKGTSNLSKIPGYTGKAAMDFFPFLLSMIKQTPDTVINTRNHPIKSLQDLAGGLARGSQNLASIGLEGGEYLTRKGAEGLLKATGHKNAKVPSFNAREFMGLEGENPINLGGMIESKNPDPLLSGLGQYGLGGASGGAKLLPMIIANFLTGGIQSPDVEHRSENAIKGAVNAAIPGMAIKGIKGASNLKMPAAFNKIDYEKPIEQIRSKYDLRDALSSKEFTDIKNEAYGRGVNIIPNIDKTIEAIEKGKYLPNTEAFKKLINKAKTGDYEAVRDLQTDLGHFGVSNRSSHIQAEKYKGIEMLDLREKINDAIQKHFKDQGHNDLADRLQNARNEYNDIIKTYHNTSGKTATTSTRAISKMVDKSKRLTPRNPETVFTEKSKPLDEFIKKHPEIAEVLKKSKDKQKQLELLNKFKIPAAVAGTMTGLDILHYLLK